MSLETFMQAFREGTGQHPFAGFLRIWQERAAFEVMPFDGAIRLGCVQSFERGKGHGSQALDWLCKLADEHEVKIRGHIEPVGDKPRLNVTQLRAWYKRHGFAEVRHREIVRLPEKLKP